MDHAGHGRGNEDGPFEPDCGCRGTALERECASAGCGFCSRSPWGRSSTLDGPHCEFESDKFDSHARITCNLDGDEIAASVDVLHLNELTARLNSLPPEEYIRDRDFIRQTW
ncbi:MAG TPA: hypothetical protein VFR37_05405 [Longimicrobium sp.]|nr:hypothetical protein [Longimicrobium sp.]